MKINNEKQRFSFKDFIDLNISPTFNHNSSIYKTSNKKISAINLRSSIEKSTKNGHSDTQLSHKIDNNKMKKVSNDNIENNNSSLNNSILMTPCIKKVDRLFSDKRLSIQNDSSKKEGKTNILKQVIADGHRYHKMKTFNLSGKKGKEIQSFQGKEKKKSIDDIYSLIEKREESENEDLKEVDEEIKKMKEEKKKQEKDYKKLLDKNSNRT